MILSNNIIGLYLLASLLIAVTAFVYSYVLTQPGEFFGKIYGKLDILFKTDARVSEGKGVHPLFKMIMWCEKCVAGQMAFWIFLACTWRLYLHREFIFVIPHILFIGLSIFQV